MFRKIGIFLESVLFPPDCPFCERIMDYREDSVCGNCLQNLPFISGKRCRRCGKTVVQEADLCDDCMKFTHVYKEGRAVFRYEKPVSEAILRFKYHGRRDYGDVFAYWMVRYLGDWIREKEIEVIVPVPIHKKRMKKRGYNQAAIIAKKIAEQMKLDYNDSSIVRCKNTIPQKKLSVIGRMGNMQSAFKVTDNRLKSKNILIIDDIYTTGMTIDIISICLLKAGAGNVYFAALSQGV